MPLNTAIIAPIGVELSSNSQLLHTKTRLDIDNNLGI